MAERTRTVAIDVDGGTEPPAKVFSWPWAFVATVGAVAVALAGWVLLAGVATIVWLSASEEGFGQAMVLATQVFALAHAVPTTLAGQSMSLAPLGLSAVLVFLALPIVGFAAKQAAAAHSIEDEQGKVHVDLERTCWQVAGVYATTYSAAVTVAVVAVLGQQALGRAVLGSVTIGLVAGLWGAAKAIGYDPTSYWPIWLRSVPRAMAAAISTMLAAGGVVVAWAAYLGRDRIVTIAEGLEPDGAGIVALIVMHLIYLPNLVLWACSWLLGAGITLGDASLVTLVSTDVGLLPAFPALGAVPSPGIAPTATLWWLAVGVVAGVLAGLIVVWSRPRARADETALIGGLAGVCAGLALTLLASIASGSLGADRLARIGARVDQLVVFAPVLLGFAGMAAGLMLGLLRQPRAIAIVAEEHGEDLVAEEEEKKE